MKNIILFDVDGTLYDNENKVVPESTKEAIQLLSQDENNILVLATGRSVYQLSVLNDYDKYFDYKVLINGQVTLKDDELVGSNPLPLELKKAIFDFVEEKQISAGFVGLDDERINLLTDAVQEGFDFIETSAPEVSKDFHINNDIYQIWLFAGQDIADQLEEKFDSLRCVSWYTEGFDVLPKDVSKVNGIERVLEKIGIKDKTIYAFGDGNNDVEMLKFADHGIAMGNASDKLKEVADFVTDSVSNDGIKKALEHFELIKY